MSIKLVAVDGSRGEPQVRWSPVGASQTVLSGDMFGLTTGGLLKRLGSGDLTSGGGIWGFGVNDYISNSAGDITAPAIPTGVNPNVRPVLGMESYNRRVYANQPIAGDYNGLAQVWDGDPRNIFIQRHKVGTRVNASLIGKKCDLVWNATTLEWEVDTTATSVNCVVVSSIQFPLYRANTTLWDSSTFATDAKGAWIAFQIVPAFDAGSLGLRY